MSGVGYDTWKKFGTPEGLRSPDLQLERIVGQKQLHLRVLGTNCGCVTPPIVK